MANNNGLLLVIAVLAVLISLANLGVVYDKVDKITGHVEEDSIVNFSLTSQANINFTTETIEFGEGLVDEDATHAILESNSTAAIDGTWTYSDAGLVLENMGNVNVSLTLQAADEEFISKSTLGGDYKWKVSDDNNEAGSCAVYHSGITESAWFDADSDAAVDVCDDFLYTNATDEIRIDVYLKVPEGLAPSEYEDTITASATAI